ncbi:MAG: hypothetical protein V7K32_10070 [Nostoc sp.]|uniref:hypothetical protein n=1 Tax=Nostoc sp. TaxID=1180 RepID=UPI002FF5214C
MKETTTVLTVLVSATLATNNFVSASEQRHNQAFSSNNNIFQQNLPEKKPQTLLAESSDLVALAQKVDGETGLAVKEWNQFFEAIPRGTMSRKEVLIRLNYLIEASQRISQHHSNAYQIAKQMPPLASRAYNDQVFLKGLITLNFSASQKFLKFNQIFSQLKSLVEANDSATYANFYHQEVPALLKSFRDYDAIQLNLTKQLVWYLGYRYYPYLGGDPEIGYAVADSINQQTRALRDAGNAMGCLPSDNCKLVPSR